jgi:CTP synthase
LFCNVRTEAVIPALDARSIYAVPAQYHEAGLDAEVLLAFGIEDAPAPDMARWDDVTDRLFNPEGEVTIGVVGKYVGLQDAYKSLTEALVHGGLANRVKVNIRWLDAELFEHEDAEVAATLEPCHAILVPGGFGERGSEGKIASVHFARDPRRPLLRHLPRHADGLHRGGAEHRRPGRGGEQRVRRGAGADHRPDHGVDERGGAAEAG